MSLPLSVQIRWLILSLRALLKMLRSWLKLLEKTLLLGMDISRPCNSEENISSRWEPPPQIMGTQLQLQQIFLEPNANDSCREH